MSEPFSITVVNWQLAEKAIGHLFELLELMDRRAPSHEYTRIIKEAMETRRALLSGGQQ